jgi:hypothetical protein
MRFTLLLSVVLAFGCSTLLDVERAREVFRGAEEPTVPILLESPALEMPAPEGLRAVSGELRAIPLKWDPVLTSDVGGYVIERAEGVDGSFMRIVALPGRFQTRYVDRGEDLAPKQGVQGGRSDLGDGVRYAYRVRTFDSSGRIAPASVPVSATTARPPTAPEHRRGLSGLPESSEAG